MNVKVDNSVWEKLKKNMLQANEVAGELGWTPSEVYGSNHDNLPMAQVANWIEEGVASQNIPPRPYMRVGLRNALKKGENKQQFDMMVKAVLDGRSAMQAYRSSSNAFENTLRKVMLDWDNPANAPLTVALKGFNDPLVETGELIANVNFKVGKAE